MARLLLLLAVLLPTVSWADGPSHKVDGPPPQQLPDPAAYWKQLYALQAEQLVNMARQFDAANAKIEEMKKSCPGESK